jgi:hypothetical protein
MAKSARDVTELVDKPPVEPHHPPIERDAKTGRFQPGNNGGPGRKRGSRSALASAFVDDLAAAWDEYGVEALKAMATLDPSKFVQCVAHVLPKDYAVTVDVSITRAMDAVSAYRMLQELPRQQLEDLRNGDNAGR